MQKTHIIIHHSLTRDSQTVSWGAIRRFHRERGWRDIGYHVGVEAVGDDYETLIGRMPCSRGAHCKELEMNTKGIGVCLVGNFDLDVPPQNQLARSAEFCNWLMDLFDIPVENVLGHREVGLLAGFDWTKGQYKSCPGNRFDMDAFRASLT